ncbi:DUF1559 family PulG-like putative transporter [Frigoriglobus tundricola]|uniref:DUF1559 domain-containing protein n=1 Tax=Frigoriglobus tundricola TaxID=2774151 RepID=A0A6M5YKQ9_9BACT|nr:DUF1559 domain-containing protein [Frigoriglobus tundricola]QJW93871.1 hypothetical protein FTUN_1385 [Frigoriglobus tundricola]
MRRGFTVLELLVALGLVAVLLALLLPAVQKVREMALVAQSQNNVRQIGLALHLAADAHEGCLPGQLDSIDAFGEATQIELLLYLDAEAKYRKFDLDSGANHYLLPVKVYVSPLDPSRTSSPDPFLFNYVGEGSDPATWSVSSYAINMTIFGKYPALNRITDGLSQTVWLTEHYAWNCGVLD